MSSYAYLNVFNKLLLEKLERLENENEELKNNYERLEKKARTDYNELYTLTNCVDLGDVERCNECVGRMWYHLNDLSAVGDYLVCDNCWDEKGYFECDGCFEPYGDDEEHMRILVKSKVNSSSYYCELCENCWDEERKKRYNKVMVELKVKLLEKV